MKILTELLAELAGMFVGEKRMTIAVLALVAGTALLIDVLGLNAGYGGALLLFGSLAVLIENVFRSANANRSMH
jgi:hypothetical protein